MPQVFWTTLMLLKIRMAIAVVMPTKDALNLGLASRSFTDIVTSRIFWALRFAPGGEYDFIFKTQKSKQATDRKKLTDWKQLYHGSAMRLWSYSKEYESGN